MAQINKSDTLKVSAEDSLSFGHEYFQNNNVGFER